MPEWGQNAAQVNNRNGSAPQRNDYPRGVPVYAPAMIPQAMENPGTTMPSDGFSAHPDLHRTVVSFGEHDELRGRMMEVSQADTYDASPNPFPANGVYDQPGAQIGILPLVRLEPSTSAHPGLALATGAGPVMIFRAPPAFSAQTTPIYALGL
jgi:hypothetical protein